MAPRKTPKGNEHTAPRQTRIITCANHKGGTGKTTTAVNISAGLAFLKKKRVLLVDFDPQGNASMALGVDIENLRYSVKDLLTGAMTDLHYLCWDKGENLKILPANATLKDVEPDLLRSVDGRLRLKHHLQTIQDQFDFIIIDTPPTLGIFTQAPLVASTEILIPVDVGYFSLQGIRQLLEEIASVRQVFNPTLDKKKILLTKFDSRTTLSGQVREILRESFGEDALKTVINVNVDIVRAQIERKSIFAYDLTSTGALDYQNVVEELLGNTVAVQPSGNVIPFRSCTCPLRINTAGSLTNRQKDKKVYTSGLSWPPSGPLPPGDALDAGRVDARRRLRPPPLAASHHSACSHSCWLRPRRHAEHQHLTQAPHPIRHPRRHRRRLGTPLLGRARPIGRLGLRQRLA